MSRKKSKRRHYMAIFFSFNGYEKKSNDFKVTSGDTELDVLSCTVSAHPLNQVWPGYQRPREQTEQSSYVSLESSEEITLDITPRRPFSSVTVRPLSKGINPTVDGGKVTLTFKAPGQYSVEFDGKHNILTVFINPEKDFGINPNDKNVIYFGAGVHHMTETICPDDNQTVYIDRGAVVCGSIAAEGKKNISVIGYGILDNGYVERGGTGGPIALSHCENIKVEGITVVDSCVWSMHFAGCKNITVDNIKLIGMWRYNSDGCDFTNCDNAIIRNSYLRNFDDCIVIKGIRQDTKLPVTNILAENCVVWCDWGRCLEIGAETSAPIMSNITFRNCDLIHGDTVMMDIQHGDRAEIENVTFKDIRVEYRNPHQQPVYQSERDMKYKNPDPNYMPPLVVVETHRTWYAVDDWVGNIKGIRFKNVQVFDADDRMPFSTVRAEAEDTVIEDVSFENVTLNGKKLTTLEEMNLHTKGDVRNIIVK